MSPIAGILLLLSAITHAGWNFLSKRQHPTLAFFFMANNIGVLLVLPILLFYWKTISLIPAFVWSCLTCSGFFLTVTMAALAGAYRTSDMSIAYPIVRSLPVIFVTFTTMLLGLGKAVGVWFILGAFLIVCGCFLLPMQTHHDFRIRNYKNLGSLLPLLAAICIAGYTMVDNEALARLRNLPGIPFSSVDATLIYIALQAISCSLWKGFFVSISPTERKYFFEVIRNHKTSAAVTGIGIYLTYGLVLASMNYVTNVSYVAAFRQISIPLGAVLGMVFLNEPRFKPKIIGITVIFAGLLLVGIA